MATKRRKGGKVGRPKTGLNVMIAIRWPPFMLTGIDEYGKQHFLDRPAALKHLVLTALSERKLVDPSALYEETHERR